MSEVSAFIREIIGAIAGDLLVLLVVLLVLVMVGSLLYALLHWAGFEVSFSRGAAPPEEAAAGPDRTESARHVERFRRGPLSISVETGEPTVLSLDREALDRAREMTAQGMGLDQVCRELVPGYADWPGFQQRAFRTTFRAAIEAEGRGEGPG